MDGVINLVMQAVCFSKRFQRVESFCAGRPVCAKDGGNITKADVLGHPLQPGLDSRMQFIAVRATVPEEFYDLYIFPAVCWLRMGQDGVITPFHNFGASSRNTGHTYA